MTTIHYRVPSHGTRLWVVRGSTLIHQIATSDHEEAIEIAFRLRNLGFVVTIDSVIDVEVVEPLLLTFPNQ